MNPFRRGSGGMPVNRKEVIQQSEADEAFKAESLYVFVQSSNVAGMQYFPITEEWQIDFHSGGRYLYQGVSPEMVREFLAAASKGKWVNRRLVKTAWPFVKLR